MLWSFKASFFYFSTNIKVNLNVSVGLNVIVFKEAGVKFLHGEGLTWSEEVGGIYGKMSSNMYSQYGHP